MREISIPSQVNKIAESSFSKCNELKYVTISDNSELRAIEKDAFSHISVCCFSFPKHLEKIDEDSFSLSTHKMNLIEFEGLEEIGLFIANLFCSFSKEVLFFTSVKLQKKKLD